MKDKGGLDILDALENLHTLVEADTLDEIEVTDDSLLIPHKAKKGKKGYWTKAGADDQTLTAIRETFRTVYSHLQSFYTKMRYGGDTRRLVEGINTIMVLVGEAAQKLDKFGTLFKSRIHEFEEYKELQDFYRERVIKESFKEFARIPIAQERPPLSSQRVEPVGDWVAEPAAVEEEIPSPDEVEEVAGVHILNDLDLIKKDHLYELFYLKNEAGHNFYTYDLARNIKLACDFSEFTDEYFGDDPLLQIKNWEDKTLHLVAQNLLAQIGQNKEKFYRQAGKYREMELVTAVNNALMALMLASNPRNLIRQFSLKGCYFYFHDFLLFLRQVLHNRDYEKFLIYSPPPGKPFFQDLLNIILLLCLKLFTHPEPSDEIRSALKQMIARGKHRSAKSFSAQLMQANEALNEVLKKHPNGPVFKAVDIIRDEIEHFFDPLLQGNIPSQQWLLSHNEHEIAVLRMPCPILQEIIDKAYVTAEFKTFLRALDPKERLLMINFQDRTSWKEHARSVAIEELARQAEFAHSFTVVTLAKDTDFYNQVGLYHDLDDADIFMEHFKEHLSDEITGYHFPPKLKRELFPSFIRNLLETIHEALFQGRKKLDLEERLNFIEIAYHLIELKLIEAVDPTYLTFCSKDGLDVTATTNVGLIALLGFLQNREWNEEEEDKIIAILYGATLINRERSVHPERFDRLISFISFLEEEGIEPKDFSPLFKPRTLLLKPII